MLLEIVFQDIQIAIVCVFFIAIAWLLAEFKGMKDELKERLGINNDTLKFRIQAYERLTLLADRISLKNLVTRTAYTNLNVVELQLLLLQNIREEYDHNVSQQIFVSTDMWKAIGNLKDQNIYIINQIAANLPNQSPAVDLSKQILEYTSNANADLSVIVLDALHFEAKQLF
jgi:hypothetical protein